MSAVRKILAASVIALMSTVVMAGGHGGGGHGGGGHSGGMSHGGGISHGGSFGGGGFHSGGSPAPAMRSSPSSGFHAPATHINPSNSQITPPSHSHNGSINSNQLGHGPTISGANSIQNSPPSFTHRHFTGASPTGNPTAAHSTTHTQPATHTTTAMRPATLPTNQPGTIHAALTTPGSTALHHGPSAGNIVNNTANLNCYRHPARRTSFFFGGYFGGFSPFGAYWGYPVYQFWPSYYSSYWQPWYQGSYYGYGVGYPAFAYQPVCTYYSGYALPPAGSAFAVNPNDPALTTDTLPPVIDSPAVNDPADSSLVADQNSDFATLGEQEFQAGHYDVAVRQWRHALVDEPGNGGLMMLLAQALFATGKYDEAAGAVQLGMQMLPPDKWGGVVEHYRELYPNIGDYTKQLRALEKTRDTSLDKPALRFLLSYHYGFLGYPKEGLKQLEKCLELAPEDAVAKKLHEHLTELAKPKPTTPATKPAPATNPPATTQP